MNDTLPCQTTTSTIQTRTRRGYQYGLPIAYMKMSLSHIGGRSGMKETATTTTTTQQPESKQTRGGVGREMMWSHAMCLIE